MLQIPPEISRQFGTLLTNKGIPLEEHVSFHKGPRFYLDFCDKNRLNPFDRTNFLAFDAKLIAKNQTESQRKQARRAMAIYYREISGPEQSSLNKKQGIMEETSHEDFKNSLRVQNKFVDQNHFVAEVVKKPLPHHPNHHAVANIIGTHEPNLFECLKLRIQDLNFDMKVLTVHDGKGQKDRTLPLPVVLLPELEAQRLKVIKLHQEDLQAGYAGTLLPNS